MAKVTIQYTVDIEIVKALSIITGIGIDDASVERLLSAPVELQGSKIARLTEGKHDEKPADFAFGAAILALVKQWQDEKAGKAKTFGQKAVEEGLM